MSTLDNSYSQAHRTLVRGPSNYPKRPGRARPLADVTMGDPKGQKRQDASSDTSYSGEHRTITLGPSNYPKRPNRPRFVDSSKEEEQLLGRGGHDPRIANTLGNIGLPSKTDTATLNNIVDSSVSSKCDQMPLCNNITKKDVESSEIVV